MVELRLLSPMEKVFLDTAPVMRQTRFEGFQNESVFLQLAVTCDAALHRRPARLHVESALKTTVRTVHHVPVTLATLPDADDNYLRKIPGLYPDLLRDARPESPVGDLWLQSGLWQSFFIEVEPQKMPTGDYPLTLSLLAAGGEVLGREQATVRVLPGCLPEQTLIRTQWFHCDCLANYYRVPVFSERHWQIIDHFMRTAVKRGCNMILTPLFTPPLDTAVGGERTTVQLADVWIENGEYRFGFERLDRYVETARAAGMRYFEMSHLFTQWGAKAAPKVMAETEGAARRLFGWETAAQSPEYAKFLRAFLPRLVAELKELGVFEQTYFHISDEPRETMLADYRAARALVEPYIEGRPIIDALSSLELYKQGAVSHPIPAINHIGPFLDAGAPDLWTYYCVGQYQDVTNAFMAMPSARTRMLGVQLYKYDLKGFLQWGYNFYNTPLSVYSVDPYGCTDAEGAFPAGDAFIVYPGADGQPEESIRSLVMHMAMQDLRALQWLEALTSRAHVLALLEETENGPLTLTEYPRDAAFFTALRERVNAEIARQMV